MQFEKQRAFRTMQRTVVERHVLESLIQSAHEEEELNRNQYARQLGNPVHVGEARRLPRRPPLSVLCLVVRTPLFILSAAVLRVTAVRGARRTVSAMHLCSKQNCASFSTHVLWARVLCFKDSPTRAPVARARARRASHCSKSPVGQKTR